MDEFIGKSCFKIAHSDECKRFWNPTRRIVTIQGNWPYIFQQCYPICLILKELYEKVINVRRKYNIGNNLTDTESN